MNIDSIPNVAYTYIHSTYIHTVCMYGLFRSTRNVVMMGEEVVSKHEELFRYLNEMLKQVRTTRLYIHIHSWSEYV